MVLGAHGAHAPLWRMASIITESSNSSTDAPEVGEASDSKVRPQRVSSHIWEGRLKQKMSKRFGMGSDVWRDVVLRLDPHSGLLGIWASKEGENSVGSKVMGIKFHSDARGTPKKLFELSCMRKLASDAHHLDIVILFSAKAEKKQVKHALHFRAPTLEDYNKWVFVLGHFGIRHEILGLDVEMRGILRKKTRAFSLRKRDVGDAGLKVDHSGSTWCCLDDDVLDELSTALDGISPCNRDWCKEVGLSPKRKTIST